MLWTLVIDGTMAYTCLTFISLGFFFLFLFFLFFDFQMLTKCVGVCLNSQCVFVIV